jgi:hypothetical protein
MIYLPGSLLYIDPGSLMPVVSALAAIAGSVLMFGRRAVAGVRSGVRTVAGWFRRADADAE